MSRKLAFFYDVSLEFSQPVREHDFVLRCVPPNTAGQRILDFSLELTPNVTVSHQRDWLGNRIQAGRIAEEHGHFRYVIRGTAERDRTARQECAASPVFRFPTPTTAPSAEMEAFLASLTLPAGDAERAWALSRAVGDYMQYQSGSTGVGTTAAEAFAAGRGVCQDFAHVFLALARRAGLDARYVNGLSLGEGSSHAWCEVWLDGVWTGIDPTRGVWADDSYIRFGVGRDFADSPFERGVFRGSARQRQSVYMKVSEIG